MPRRYRIIALILSLVWTCMIYGPLLVAEFRRASGPLPAAVATEQDEWAEPKFGPLDIVIILLCWPGYAVGLALSVLTPLDVDFSATALTINLILIWLVTWLIAQNAGRDRKRPGVLR